MPQRILVVEDEPAIAESVAYALKRDGFSVDVALTFAEAERALEGFDLIVRMRREGRITPIIVLSSRDGEADRVAALETGADDYVTKPFSPREVVARVRAVLRRSARGATAAAGNHTELPISVEESTRRAQVSGREIDLTRVEFDLLASLLETPGRVYTRAQLIDRVWGDGFAISDRTVDSHVKALRKKVAEAGGDPGLIETVRGVGYRVTDRPSENGDKP